MDTSRIINEILAQPDGMVWEGDQVFMPAYQLHISGELAEQTEHPDRFVVMVHFRVSHQRLFPNGLADFAVAMGDTLELACREAVRVWVEGALTTIMHACHSEDACECVVTKATLTSLTGPAQTPVVWDLFIGPLQGISPQADHVSIDNHTVLKAILPPLTGELSDPSVLWVRAVLTKQGKESQNECYLNNAAWSNGITALYDITDSWGKIDGFVLLRQCFICVPTDREASPEKVADLQRLYAEVNRPAPITRKWWQFWK